MNHMAVPDDNIIQLSKGLKGTTNFCSQIQDFVEILLFFHTMKPN